MSRPVHVRTLPQNPPEQPYGWIALLEGLTPSDPIGVGATAAKALADLNRQIQESHNEGH